MRRTSFTFRGTAPIYGTIRGDRPDPLRTFEHLRHTRLRRVRLDEIFEAQEADRRKRT